MIRAAEELVARSGAKTVHVVGLRLGAALAVAAVQRGGLRLSRPIQSVILWDALLSGHEFLQQARTFQDRILNDRGRFSAETIRRRPASGGGDYLVGYAFPESLRRSLEQLDLHDAGTLAGRRHTGGLVRAVADLGRAPRAPGRGGTRGLHGGDQGRARHLGRLRPARKDLTGRTALRPDRRASADGKPERP